MAFGGYLVVVGPIGRRPGQGLRGKSIATEFGVWLVSASVGLIAIAGGYGVEGFDTASDLLAPLGIAIGGGRIEELFFRGILLRVLDS